MFLKHFQDNLDASDPGGPDLGYCPSLLLTHHECISAPLMWYTHVMYVGVSAIMWGHAQSGLWRQTLLAKC